jgi:hypothetical protein
MGKNLNIDLDQCFQWRNALLGLNALLGFSTANLGLEFSTPEFKITFQPIDK